MNECLICKKHYTQSGNCYLNKKNCLIFEEEPQGRVFYQEFLCKFTVWCGSLIKPGKYIETEEGMKIKVLKIKEVNLLEQTILVEASFHEKDKPAEMRRREFVLMKGGKNERLEGLK